MIHTYDGIEFELPQTFVIHGIPISWKNSKEIKKHGRGRNARRSIGATDHAHKWMRHAIASLVKQRTGGTVPLGVKLHVIVTSYCKGRKVDGDNLLGGPWDALENAGVIANDSEIESPDGSRRVMYAKTPRVEITVDIYRE